MSYDHLPADLAHKLENCPTNPGVYVMRDEGKTVIYVGKAKNLRNRVRTYFQLGADHEPKTVILVGKVRDIEYLETGSEEEALILENTLIKKWKPRYNIRLRDDKTYPFLKLDFNHDFPRPYVARRPTKQAGVEYFGPFPNGGAFSRTLELASKVFQIRDCRDHEFANRSRPCLSHQIGQCTAPCVAYVTKEDYAKQVAGFLSFLKGGSQELEEKWEREMFEASERMDFEEAARLRDRLTSIRATVGQNQRMVDTADLTDRDIWASWPAWGERNASEVLDVAVLQFRGGRWIGQNYVEADLAEKLADEELLSTLLLQYYGKHPCPPEIVVPEGSVGDFHAVGAALAKIATLEEAPRLRAPSETSDLAKAFDLASQNVRGAAEWRTEKRRSREDGLDAIAKMLELAGPPRRIECVDISNFQGAANVASAVVFVDGRPEKAQYRHYKIQGFSGQNDFASMREVMSRRYAKPDSPVPDLLVVDGGKGQLASATEILKGLGCTFPVVGLAKARTKRNFASSDVETSEERIFVPNQKNPIRIKNIEAFRILTQIRDEAHRFAIEFHRKKRDEASGL